MAPKSNFFTSSPCSIFPFLNFPLRALAVITAMWLCGGAPIHSQTREWNPEGRPICTADGWQRNVRAASDGKAGAIVAWEDIRTGSQPAIYAARLNADSTLPWQENGVLISTASSGQTLAGIVADDAGGAFIAWWNRRNGTQDIYVQHIDANGSVLWQEDGLAVCNAEKDQMWANIIADGNGGAILAWQDSRDVDIDIFAQRLSPSGEALWTPNGLNVTSAGNDQNYPELASDQHGGAYIVWMDKRTEDDIYCQHIRADGSIAWVGDLPIAVFPNRQLGPKIAPRGSNGAIIVWQDYRISTAVSAIYIQLIDSTGGVHFPDGHQLAASPSSQSGIFFARDGRGGAIAVWTDFRNGLTDGDVYLGRINADGSVPNTSSPFGQPVCTLAGSAQELSQVLPDSAWGVFVVWQDKRNTFDYDVYMNRLTSDDNALWHPDGDTLIIHDHGQITPQVLPSGRGKAIVVWVDGRVADGQADLYAQRIAYAPWLSLTTRAGDMPIRLVNGIATSDTLDFGILRLGNVAYDTITIANSGALPLLITEIRRPPIGNASDFRILTNLTFPIVLPPDSSLSIAVMFLPSDNGVRTTEIRIRSDFSTETVIIPLRGVGTDPRIYTVPSFAFGPVKLGFEQDTVLENGIRNIGDGVLLITDIAIQGDHKDDFLLRNLPAFPFVVDPGAGVPLGLRFHPTGDGVRTAEILVSNNSSDSVKIIQLRGAAGHPEFSSSPTRLHFDNVMITRSQTKQLSLINSGNAELVINLVKVDGTDRASFGVDWSGPLKIQNNAAMPISVHFAPVKTGVLHASLVVESDANDSPHFIDLDGTGETLNDAPAVPSSAVPMEVHWYPNPVSLSSGLHARIETPVVEQCEGVRLRAVVFDIFGRELGSTEESFGRANAHRMTIPPSLLQRVGAGMRFCRVTLQSPNGSVLGRSLLKISILP